jgi:cytochrome b
LLDGHHKDELTIRKVTVWDLAVRVFHWSLAALVIAAWATGGTGTRWHEVTGYAVAGLVAFRIAWGFTGTRHARFTDFVGSPREIGRHIIGMVRGRLHGTPGHNPAGGAMILALLTLLIMLCITGWLMTTPRLFGVEWVETLHALAADGIAILVPMHVLGVVLTSLAQRENLILAMITGTKSASSFVVDTVGERRNRRLAMQGLALLIALAGMGAAYGWVSTSGRVSTTLSEASQSSPAK